jgi:hypothetical protein
MKLICIVEVVTSLPLPLLLLLLLLLLLQARRHTYPPYVSACTPSTSRACHYPVLAVYALHEHHASQMKPRRGSGDCISDSRLLHSSPAEVLK